MEPNEEPTLPPAEQMRQKRLAMLGGTSNSSSATPKAPQTPSPSETPKPAPKSSRETATPDGRSDAKAQGANTPIHSKSKEGTKVSGKPATMSASSTSMSQPPTKKINVEEESFENWSDRILSDVFRITLDLTRSRPGLKFTDLPNLRQELQDSGEPVKLTALNLESAILEMATSIPHNKPLLDYLLPCFKRAARAISTSRRLTPEKQHLMDEAKRLSMSNCIFAVTMPELFSREPNPTHDSLVKYLLRSHDSEDGICLDFFNAAVSMIPEDDTVASVFVDAMVYMSQKLAKMTMNDSYLPYINCLNTYCRYPVLLDALAQHPQFLFKPPPDLPKEQIALASEVGTILGPFFRISPLQTDVTKMYFASPRTIDPGHVKQAQTALQTVLQTYQGYLVSIINSFIRASPTTRNFTLDWFAFIMNTNHKRRALHVNPAEISSDGLMVNVTTVLDKLCEPFMDASYSKISKIDINYLRRSPRIDLSDETKLNTDQATSEAFYAEKADGTSNFISEVFFLNLAAHHYGTGATNARLKDLGKDIKHFERLEKDFAEEVRQAEAAPMKLAIARKQHERVITILEKSIATRYAIEGVLTDTIMQSLSVQFMRYVTVWLLRMASGSQYTPGQKLSLPLPGEKPLGFSCLPEYALQNIVDNFKFVSRYVPKVMMSAVGDETVALCITFLRSSDYIKNPYLKSSLVTLLFAGTWPMYHLSRGILGDILMGSEFANEYLLHALMKFYIECERSGVSTAFYDRFNIRYEIFQVIKAIWPNDVYRDQLSEESKVNRQFFVQFVNLLLNDATYLLDEALGKLVKIHDYQKTLQDQSMSSEDREKVEGDLEQAESQCQSWMSLVNDTLSMMKLFTDTLKDAFTMPEIAGRLASMLDYNLESVVGPKRGNLKVEDPKKYNFDAKSLLSSFVDIYLNLGSKESFIEAVAADGRSYKPSNFDEASRILSEKALKPPQELARWAELKQKFLEAKERADQAELDLGEIPEEFEDPLMGTLMEDPVQLPSNNIVDRSTIVQQLLSNPLDPFTRSPMTIEQVVPVDELRERIKAWKAEKIAAAKAKGVGSDFMDTTAG